MKDALLNVVRNAIQAVEQTGTIFLKVYRKNRTCVMEIKDTGPGITEEDLPFIFDPFYTTKKQGTGLGLTITHRIVEEHDGRIEVESRAGEGSLFRLLIPIKET
jgi:signal transduction histidine kinase